uniref:Uncharacterized protein n=1 Tax=Octopus bimaculoides TaxID=37653 RepID=A0A0L8FFP1_OCTBM
MYSKVDSMECDQKFGGVFTATTIVASTFNIATEVAVLDINKQTNGCLQKCIYTIKMP